MTMPYADTSAATIRGQAATGIGVASAHGWDIPDRVTRSEALHAEARRLADTQPPTVGDLPDDPANLEAHLREHATAAGVHVAFTEAAEAAAEFAGRDIVVAYRAALPGWFDRLAAEFAGILAGFVAARATAPPELGGYEDDQQTAAYLAVQRAAPALDRHRNDRVTFGQTIGEQGAHHASPWVVLRPPADAEPDEVQTAAAAIGAYTSRDWQALTAADRWGRLVDLGWELSLPGAGGLAGRVVAARARVATDQQRRLAAAGR